MKLRVAGVKKESLIDGPGVSFVIFTQGCYRECPECHNPDARSLEGGTDFTLEELKEEIGSSKYIDTLVFSGGEPFLQAEELARLGEWAQKRGLKIVTYSGYTFEYLLDKSNEHSGYRQLLEISDILIDGAYVDAERDLMLAFRGSKNQRIIDVKPSLQSGEAVIMEKFG